MENWKEEALSMVEDYPEKEFKTEDVRNWAYEKGLPVPNNCRIWGVVIKNAVKRGLIEHIGFKLVDNPNAHRTPASFWRKAVV